MQNAIASVSDNALARARCRTASAARPIGRRHVSRDDDDVGDGDGAAARALRRDTVPNVDECHRTRGILGTPGASFIIRAPSCRRFG